MSKSQLKRIAALKKADPEEETVTIAEWCRLTGDTDPAVRGRMRNGYWIEGAHYRRKTRRIRLIKNACHAWWAQKG